MTSFAERFLGGLPQLPRHTYISYAVASALLRLHRHKGRRAANETPYQIVLYSIWSFISRPSALVLVQPMIQIFISGPSSLVPVQPKEDRQKLRDTLAHMCPDTVLFKPKLVFKPREEKRSFCATSFLPCPLFHLEETCGCRKKNEAEKENEEDSYPYFAAVAIPELLHLALAMDAVARNFSSHCCCCWL